jgi:hypothetical protein
MAVSPEYILKPKHLNFQLSIVLQSINREVITYKVRWLTFEISIRTINIRGGNIHHGGEVGKGAFGTIRAGEFNKEKFVIKCVPITSDKSRIRAIREYLLMKVCSNMQIGPKVSSYLGFDMLMY